MKTRREFIKQGLVAGATFALSSGCGLRLDEISGIDSASIEKLRANFAGQLILPGDQIYDSARAVFWRSPLTDKRPALIAGCVRPGDVARCIEFAEQQELPLAVRGGAHSFLGWGTCNDGLVIDTSPMKEIIIDPVNRTAQAGAGVLAQELVAAASPHGLAPVLGQCASVGVSGLTLGGGLGWLSGKHGATCDTLLSAELVTADGRTVVTSANEHPDLFWAIRGGGGNFGIATSFEYRLYPIDDVTAGRLWYRFDDARTVLRFFGDFMAGAPDELQALVALAPRDGERLVRIDMCWSGSPGDAEDIVRPLRTVAKPVGDTVQRRAYIDTFNIGVGDDVSWKYSALKGSYLQSLSDDAIDIVLDSFARAPGPRPAIGLDHYMHGAVCRVAPDSTAFELRMPNALHVWIVASWDDPAAASPSFRWIDETWSALQAHAAGRVYANYPAAEGDAAVRAVYGQNHSRLVAVKNEYDPRNVFQRNYNIRPGRA